MGNLFHSVGQTVRNAGQKIGFTPRDTLQKRVENRARANPQNKNIYGLAVESHNNSENARKLNDNYALYRQKRDPIVTVQRELEAAQNTTNFEKIGKAQSKLKVAQDALKNEDGSQTTEIASYKKNITDAAKAIVSQNPELKRAEGIREQKKKAVTGLFADTENAHKAILTDKIDNHSYSQAQLNEIAGKHLTVAQKQEYSKLTAVEEQKEYLQRTKTETAGNNNNHLTVLERDLHEDYSRAYHNFTPEELAETGKLSGEALHDFIGNKVRILDIEKSRRQSVPPVTPSPAEGPATPPIEGTQPAANSNGTTPLAGNEAKETETKEKEWNNDWGTFFNGKATEENPTVFANMTLGGMVRTFGGISLASSAIRWAWDSLFGRKEPTAADLAVIQARMARGVV